MLQSMGLQRVGRDLRTSTSNGNGGQKVYFQGGGGDREGDSDHASPALGSVGIHSLLMTGYRSSRALERKQQ